MGHIPARRGQLRVLEALVSRRETVRPQGSGFRVQKTLRPQDSGFRVQETVRPQASGWGIGTVRPRVSEFRIQETVRQQASRFRVQEMRQGSGYAPHSRTALVPRRETVRPRHRHSTTFCPRSHSPRAQTADNSHVDYYLLFRVQG